MNFFPPVTPVQVNPLDLADIQKNNIGNAMGRVGLQNMQDEMSARKAMGEFITQNGGIPQSTEQVNQLAMTLASRGLPMDKAFEVASKAQQFAMGNMELGAMQQFMAPRGSQPGASPIPGMSPAGQVQPSPQPRAQQMPDPLASAGNVGSIPMANILEAAKTAGAEDLGPALAKFVSAESGGNPNAQAGTSSARGLGQFTGPTRQYIMNKYGVDAWSQDPNQQLQALAYLAKESRGSLAQSMGVDESQVTPGQLYMSHFLGQAGAPKFLGALQSSPNAPAIQFASPQAVQANSGVFFGEGGQPRSVQQVYDLMAAKVEPQGVQAMTPSQPMPQAGSSSPLMADLKDRVTNAPGALMIPRIAAMVKAASELEGFISPQDKAQLDLWVAKQTEGAKKQMEAQYAGPIAASTEEGKARGALAGEKAGGAPVSPGGMAAAAGMKSGAEEKGRLDARLGAGVEMPLKEKTDLETTAKNQQESKGQVLALQKEALPALEQDAQRYQRLGQIYSLSNVSGVGTDANIMAAKALDAIAPGRLQELQQKATSQVELQKLTAQELAAQIKALGGNHNEMSQDIEKMANPNTTLTPQMLREVVGKMMDQMRPRIQHHLTVLGKGNGDQDLTDIHQSAIGLWKPVIDQTDSLRQTADTGNAAPGAQGQGQVYQVMRNPDGSYKVK